MTDPGTFIELDGRPVVRFVRTCPHPIERVWAAVTTSEGLARWFPAEVRIDLQPGGMVTYGGDPYTESPPGRVLACDPPSHLAVTWGDDELRFELEPLDGGGCRFTLFDLLGGRDAAARNAAGWDVCLGELDKYLAGAAADGPHRAQPPSRGNPVTTRMSPRGCLRARTSRPDRAVRHEMIRPEA